MGSCLGVCLINFGKNANSVAWQENMWEAHVCCYSALPIVLIKALTHRNTSSSQPRRGSPSEQSSKMQIEGTFKREAHMGSLPVSLPCTTACPGQPSQLQWKIQEPFAYCWNLTTLNWAIWDKHRTGAFWCPLASIFKALGNTAALLFWYFP